MDRIFLFDLGNVLAKSLDDYYLYNKLNCKIPYNEFLQYFLCGGEYAGGDRVYLVPMPEGIFGNHAWSSFGKSSDFWSGTGLYRAEYLFLQHLIGI